jgi:hypothetical protein
MGALTSGILAAQDTWALTDGSNGNPATTGTDSGTGLPDGTANAYLSATVTNPGSSPLTFNGTEGTDYTWNTATVGAATNTTVLGLDGTTGYGATSAAVLTTNASFTVSAWVDLTGTAHNAAAVAQDGNNNSGFYLGCYNGAWDFWFTTDGGASPVAQPQAIKTGASTGWHYLTGVFNATTHSTQLFVDGVLGGSATGVYPWNAGGGLTVGRDKWAGAAADFFPGDVSDVQAWNYALTGPQITALFEQIG